MSVITYVPDSSKIIHETQVDFKTRSIAKPVILVQYDKSLPIVAVKLYLGGEVFVLPVGADVKIRWGKRDRTFVYKDVLGCNAARNTLYFDVDAQMSFYPGGLNPILEMTISGNIAGSSPIPVTIDKNPMQEEDIESSSQYIDLDQAVLDAEAAKVDAEAAAEYVRNLVDSLPLDNVPYALYNKGLIPIEDVSKHMIQVGVRWVDGSSISEGERVKIDEHGFATYGAATGLVHGIGINDVEAYNSFDELPAFRYEKLETEMGLITRFFPNSFQRKFKRKDTDDVTRVYWMQSATKFAGYHDPYPFIRDDGTVADYIDYQRFHGVIVDSKLMSIRNSPASNVSHIELMTAARLHDGLGVNSRYSVKDEKLIDYLYTRWVIRLGTKDLQARMLGVVNLSINSNRKTIGTKENANNVQITNEQSSSFRVGMTIIGDATTHVTSSPTIFRRRITAIILDDPSPGIATIQFDGAPVASIPENSVVTSHPWMSGATEIVTAAAGYIGENNGLYPCAMEGIENPWGNMYEGVAGVKVRGTEIWVTDKRVNYNFSTSTDGYTMLDTTVPLSSGYIKAVTEDVRFPWVNMPTEVGGSATTYFADHLYQSPTEGSYRIVLRGGAFAYARYAGPLICNVHHALSFAYYYITSRAFSQSP